MIEGHISKDVYDFIIKACKLLDYYILSIYDNDHFVLMDAGYETPNEYDISTLEELLKARGYSLKFNQEQRYKNQDCSVCKGLGYIEYETGVEHGGIVEIANIQCGCLQG